MPRDFYIFSDPKTSPTTISYDALNRVATVTDALTGVTTPGYDALDNVTSMQDQRSHSTTYTYNAFGDVTGETSPDRGTLSYTVDANGNVTQRTDARSVVTNYTYDVLNRLATVAYPSDSSLNATLTYDSSSGCGTPYKGHLCSISDAAGTEAYQYDALGRVTQDTQTRGGNAFVTSYTYDLAGNIATVTLPSSRVVTYTLNSNGLVSNVAAPINGTATNLASSITYLPFGPLNALTYGNALTFSATFDHDYNPTNRTVSGSIYNNTYVTDANSNVTQAGTPTYGYDALNRVNAENPGTAASYTYDATDNRLTKVQGGTTTTTVPSTSNKISAVGTNSYSYDAAGDISGDGINTYTWSAAGNLATVNTTGGVYTYDVQNRRTKKVAGGVTTYYVYGLDGTLYGEYSSTFTMVREYVYLNAAPLAQVNTGSPETVTYLHTDHLGTPRYATNAAGTSVWSWTADAFGVSTPSGSVTVNLGMPGQYYDSESGVFYNVNRYYNPAIGRYLNSDPIGIAGGLNIFSYVGQNPVMNFDLLGLRDFSGPETQKLFLAPAFRSATSGGWSGLLNIYNHSKGEGDYDFGWDTNPHKTDTFCINGYKLSASEFGNYIAGYQGASYDLYFSPLIGVATRLVYTGGAWYHLIGRTDPPDLFDVTGWPYITIGVNGAWMNPIQYLPNHQRCTSYCQ